MKIVLDPSTDSKDNGKKDLPNNQLSLKLLLPPAALAVALTVGCAGTDAGSDDEEEEENKDTILDNPSFTAPVVVAGLPGQAAGFSSYKVFQPALADMDGDGDLDIFAGTAVYQGSSSSYISFDFKLVYFKNTGGDALSFEESTGIYSALPTDSRNWYTSLDYPPMFVAANDIDGDNEVDLLTATNMNSDGFRVRFRTLVNNGDMSFDPTVNTNSNYFASQPLADLDGDGDADKIIGFGDFVSYSDGGPVLNYGINYLKNDGSGTFGAPASLIAEEEKLGKDKFPIPSFADLDNDGDQDMFVVTFDTGAINYYENTGSKTSPDFVSRTENFNLIPTGGVKWFPAFGDMDGDGDLDAIIGTSDGKILFAENLDIE